MNPGTITALKVGERLPPLDLRTRDQTVSLRSSPQRRLATVLLLTHDDGGCVHCGDFARRLTAEIDWRDWDGRLLVAIPGGGAIDGLAIPPAPALVTRIEAWTDESGQEGPGTACLLVADRYGQLYHAERIGRDHAFPDPPAIEEWLRFLATQCPECGVIDEPA